jgi:hypothetical protein
MMARAKPSQPKAAIATAPSVHKPLPGHRISAATYNAMWDAYAQQPSARAVARKLGLSRQVCDHYITGPGAPDIGMEPIRERWIRVQAAVQEEQELTVLSLRRTEMDWARKQLTALHGEMELALADVRKRVQEYQASGGTAAPRRELKLAELVVAYNNAVRTVEHLLGGPDAVVESRKGYDPLDSLSEEEAMVYVTTGVLPDSIRLAVAVEVPRRSKGPR